MIWTILKWWEIGMIINVFLFPIVAVPLEFWNFFDRITRQLQQPDQTTQTIIATWKESIGFTIFSYVIFVLASWIEIVETVINLGKMISEVIAKPVPPTKRVALLTSVYMQSKSLRRTAKP